MAADEGDAADTAAPAPAVPDDAGDTATARPRPTPGGRHAAPEEPEDRTEPVGSDEPAEPGGPTEPAEPVPPRRSSRRAVLLSAAAVVLAAGGGVGAGLLGRRRRAPVLPLPPAELVAAAAAERRLIADLDATTGGSAQVRVVVTQARANHAAHLSALDALLGAYRRPAGRATPASPAPGVARTAAALRAAETTAAVDAAGRAAATDGALATLLASISACESTHAALLA